MSRVLFLLIYVLHGLKIKKGLVAVNDVNLTVSELEKHYEFLVLYFFPKEPGSACWRKTKTLCRYENLEPLVSLKLRCSHFIMSHENLDSGFVSLVSAHSILFEAKNCMYGVVNRIYQPNCPNNLSQKIVL